MSVKRIIPGLVNSQIDIAPPEGTDSTRAPVSDGSSSKGIGETKDGFETAKTPDKLDAAIRTAFTPLTPQPIDNALGGGVKSGYSFNLGFESESAEEPQIWWVGPDTDKDGLTDHQEKFLGTNPKDPDTDHDGILDGEDETPGTRKR